MNNKKRVSEMYRMIGEGKSQEAFEQYYHPKVVMIEGTGERCEGKEANRARHGEWYASIESVNGAGVDSITSDEDKGITMVETWNDFTFKGGVHQKMEQIARQKWEDGKIVEERFYYDTRQPS